MADGTNNSGTGLNEFQARHLRVACQHIDKLLSDLESVMHSSESKSVFPRYVPELSPVQRKTIEDYTARLRAQLLRVLETQGIESEPSRVAEAHAVHNLLTFVEIALEELTPEDMAGYGAVAPDAATDLKGIVQELSATVSEMHSYVLQRSRHDADARLRKLHGQSSFVEMLAEVQRIISRYGFVEFRPRLLMLLDLLEDRSFEIGIFGRVSSGKSSLLNHVIGEDVLPVGVTPITAVPTRIRYGNPARLLVFGDQTSSAEFPVSKLAAFVDERFNPANQKRVSRIVLELDVEALKGGLVFVDTPGLGSLATSGAAETLAYLPRCDYGIILIDAAGALSPEDLRTIEALKSASIPVSVLISKADLLSADDLHRLTTYVSDHVAKETGFRLPVHAVSVIASYQELLQTWLNEEIGPLHSRVAELKETSLARKCEALVRSVVETLRRESARDKSQPSPKDAEQAESILRRASAEIADTRKSVRNGLDQPAPLDALVTAAAEEVTEKWSIGETESLTELSEKLSRQASETAASCYVEVKKLAHTLHSQIEDASRALGVNTAPIEPFRFKELPVFDAPVMNRELKRPAFAFLGRWIAGTAARRGLAQFRPTMDEALKAYKHRLQNWAETSIGGVESQFESYAQEYRMQAQRLATGMTSKVGSPDMKSDIEVLERFVEAEQLQPASGM